MERYGNRAADVYAREGEVPFINKVGSFICRDWSKVRPMDCWFCDCRVADIAYRVPAPERKEGWKKVRPLWRQVATVDGKVSYTVPEGTQSGTVFRLRNKGVPYVNGGGRGDQYVRVNIEVPKNLSGKQKDLLKEFDKLSSDKNFEKRKGFFDKLKEMFD